MLRVMDAMDHLPVLLLGNRSEILARNALLVAVLGDAMEPGTPFVRYLITNPDARRRIVNWADFAATSIAALRRETARRPFDRRLATLIDDLRSSDPEVGRWWQDHRVRDYASVAKVIDHPVAGRLAFDIEILEAPRQPDQRLVLYTTQRDSVTAQTLPMLASWKGPTQISVS